MPRRFFSRPEIAIERVAWEHKNSEMAEAIRSVLASLLLPGRAEETPQTLVITSPQPGEGKTTVAANLAIALADLRYRVLLVDGDLRRPRLHRIFDVANTWGLSNLLGEKDEVLELPPDRLIRKTSIPNLGLLPSGPGTDRIFQCLYAPKTERLIRRFRQEFDYVLIDAPPCMEFADARILARNADGVLLVFRANRTRCKAAQAVAARFAADRIPVIGAVLNDWDPRASASHNDHRYYPHYPPNQAWDSGGTSMLILGARHRS